MRVRSIRMGTPSIDRSRSNSNSGAPGAEAEGLGLVDRGRARATFEHARARREPARGRHLREAHERVRRLADAADATTHPAPRARDHPGRASSASARRSVTRLTPKCSASARSGGSREPGGPPPALDLVRELVLDRLVAQLEPIERGSPVGLQADIRTMIDRHAGRKRTDRRPWLDPVTGGPRVARRDGSGRGHGLALARARRAAALVVAAACTPGGTPGHWSSALGPPAPATPA